MRKAKLITKIFDSVDSLLRTAEDYRTTITLDNFLTITAKSRYTDGTSREEVLLRIQIQNKEVFLINPDELGALLIEHGQQYIETQLASL